MEVVQDSTSADKPSIECEKDYWYIPIERGLIAFALLICQVHKKYSCYFCDSEGSKLPENVEAFMRHGLRRNCLAAIKEVSSKKIDP